MIKNYVATIVMDDGDFSNYVKRASRIKKHTLQFNKKRSGYK